MDDAIEILDLNSREGWPCFWFTSTFHTQCQTAKSRRTDALDSNLFSHHGRGLAETKAVSGNEDVDTIETDGDADGGGDDGGSDDGGSDDGGDDEEAPVLSLSVG